MSKNSVNNPSKEGIVLKRQFQKKKFQPCRNYMDDRCSNGIYCTYMHQDFPCKFYYMGIDCPNVECKFLHNGPLPVVILEAFLLYMKSRPIRELKSYGLIEPYSDLKNIIDCVQTDLIIKNYDHDLSTESSFNMMNDARILKPLEESLSFLSELQLSQLRRIGIKNHHEVLMLSNWQLLAVGITDGDEILKIIDSCCYPKKLQQNVNENKLELNKNSDLCQFNLPIWFPRCENETEIANVVNGDTEDESDDDFGNPNEFINLPKEDFRNKIKARREIIKKLPQPKQLKKLEKFNEQLIAIKKFIKNSIKKGASDVSEKSFKNETSGLKLKSDDNSIEISSTNDSFQNFENKSLLNPVKNLIIENIDKTKFGLKKCRVLIKDIQEGKEIKEQDFEENKEEKEEALDLSKAISDLTKPKNCKELENINDIQHEGIIDTEAGRSKSSKKDVFTISREKEENIKLKDKQENKTNKTDETNSLKINAKDLKNFSKTLNNSQKNDKKIENCPLSAGKVQSQKFLTEIDFLKISEKPEKRTMKRISKEPKRIEKKSQEYKKIDSIKTTNNKIKDIKILKTNKEKNAKTCFEINKSTLPEIIQYSQNNFDILKKVSSSKLQSKEVEMFNNKNNIYLPVSSTSSNSPIFKLNTTTKRLNPESIDLKAQSVKIPKISLAYDSYRVEELISTESKSNRTTILCNPYKVSKGSDCLNPDPSINKNSNQNQGNKSQNRRDPRLHHQSVSNTKSQINQSDCRVTQEDLLVWEAQYMKFYTSVSTQHSESSLIKEQNNNSSQKILMSSKNISDHENPSDCGLEVHWDSKKNCETLLPWNLIEIEIPEAEINKPIHLNQLISKTELKDRRLLKYEHLNIPDNHSPVHFFNVHQSDKNNALLQRTLRESQWFRNFDTNGKRNIIERIITGLGGALNAYHEACMKGKRNLKFELNSIKFAYEIIPMLNRLGLSVTDNGEVELDIKSPNNSIDNNNTKRDYNHHETERTFDFNQNNRIIYDYNNKYNYKQNRNYRRLNNKQTQYGTKKYFSHFDKKR